MEEFRRIKLRFERFRILIQNGTVDLNLINLNILPIFKFDIESLSDQITTQLVVLF